MKGKTTDIDGREIVEGDTVRVLTIDPDIIGKLNDEEREDVESMLGETFEVEEIDKHGCAWVTKWWDRGN